jgi:hypothetical protein
MANTPGNREIVEGMRASVQASAQKLASSASVPQCNSGFTVADFSVTYPNNELIADVMITGVPAGVTLLGVTVLASPSEEGSTTYCMGVASDSDGLPIPISVMGASTSPSFSAPTEVTGMVVLYYMEDGTAQQCVLTQQFTVG